ncbi:hypothetical protein EYF80_006333 [Liparis tanakae]|uniref:Uncharacterized protein n=1 Tax=Liparis tanakae TaxID=230148 RepID=A0A4Z2J1G3_9TELE|nr:hypothetical protein EYF80_006333 [Liparis tanakae]
MAKGPAVKTCCNVSRVRRKTQSVPRPTLQKEEMTGMRAWRAVSAQGHLAHSIVSAGAQALVFGAGAGAAEEQRVALQAAFSVLRREGGEEVVHLQLHAVTLQASFMLMKRNKAGSQISPAPWHAVTHDWSSSDAARRSALRGGQAA